MQTELLTSVIQRRHLSCLTSDKSATRLDTTSSDTLDNVCGSWDIKLTAREVIKEEQGFGSLYDEIVDTHGNEIDSCGETKGKLRE